jgi:hypothetical protein
MHCILRAACCITAHLLDQLKKTPPSRRCGWSSAPHDMWSEVSRHPGNPDITLESLAVLNYHNLCFTYLDLSCYRLPTRIDRLHGTTPNIPVDFGIHYVLLGILSIRTGENLNLNFNLILANLATPKILFRSSSSIHHHYCYCDFSRIADTAIRHRSGLILWLSTCISSYLHFRNPSRTSRLAHTNDTRTFAYSSIKVYVPLHSLITLLASIR